MTPKAMEKNYLLSLVFLFLQTSFVTCQKCTLEHKDPSKVKILESISLLTGLKYVAVNNGFSYAVSICSDVSKGNHPNASVTRSHISKNTTTILGRYNESDIVAIQGKKENAYLLTYSGGDMINETTDCNGTRWRTLIFIDCDHNADDISIDLLDALNVGCFAFFHLKTSVSCPPSNAGSVFLGWLLVFVLLISGMFIIGFLYKRYVEGAKGWEQVPFYDFLRNPAQHLNSVSRSEYTVPPRVIPNDPADEPLLRP